MTPPLTAELLDMYLERCKEPVPSEIILSPRAYRIWKELEAEDANDSEADDDALR